MADPTSNEVPEGRSSEPESSFSFLKPIRKDILQDASTDLPGFVAGEIEEQEESYLENHGIKLNYGSIAKADNDVETNVSEVCQISAAEEKIPKAKLRIIMLSMYLGIFLAAIDNTIVSTLLAHIASEFNELPRISWIATAYLFSSATFQPLYGKISDIFGRKPLLIFTNIAFLVGCLMCGLSRSFWWLVIARFVAGVGGGGITSMSSITISDIVPLRDRALYQGMSNLFFGLGTACGGIVGGWFSDNGGGWRVAFLMQVPLSAISVILIFHYLQLPRKNVSPAGEGCISVKSKILAIDWWGAIALVIFLTLFLSSASLGGGEEIPYNSKSFLALCLSSSLSFIVFVYIELKIARDPILPLSFLKDRSVLGSSLSNWCCMMVLMTTTYYLPVYFSAVLNMKPTDIGKRLLPNFFSVAFGSLGAGYYMKRTGKYYWFVIFFCAIAVLGQFQIFLINPTISTWRQYILTIIPGFGTSVLITVALLAMIAAVPHKHQAATTSISYAFRSTGSTLGVAIGGAIFRQSLSELLNRKVLHFASDEHPKKELLEIIKKASSSSEWVHDSAPEYIRPALISSYHYAAKNTFLFCFICSIGTLLSIAIIREKKLYSSINREED